MAFLDQWVWRRCSQTFFFASAKIRFRYNLLLNWCKQVFPIKFVWWYVVHQVLSCLQLIFLKIFKLDSLFGSSSLNFFLIVHRASWSLQIYMILKQVHLVIKIRIRQLIDYFVERWIVQWSLFGWLKFAFYWFLKLINFLVSDVHGMVLGDKRVSKT